MANCTWLIYGYEAIGATGEMTMVTNIAVQANTEVEALAKARALCARPNYFVKGCTENAA